MAKGDEIDNRGELTTKQANMNRNPTGKGGFQDHPELRHNGAWKKENTPRGKLEKLLNEVTVGEFMEQIQSNDDTNVDMTLGDMLMSARVNRAIKRDPDNPGKIEVDEKSLDSLLYFVYGSKSENDMNLKAEDGVPLIRGFVIPVLPDNAVVIPDEGADGQPDA